MATREHEEFASAIEMIDLMPPGLYEAVIEEVAEETANRALIGGNYLFRLIPRTLDDIRKLGGNSPEDNLEFAAVERVSTMNHKLYETYLGPLVRSLTPPGFSEWARTMHPNRMRFAVFSDENPLMRNVARTRRRSASRAGQHPATNVLSGREGDGCDNHVDAHGDGQGARPCD